MPDKKITQLTAKTSLGNSDLIPIVDNSTSITKKITWANVLASIASYLSGAISTVLTNNLTASKLAVSNSSGKLASSSFLDTDIQNGGPIYAVATGTDTYVITLSPVPSAYGAGQTFRVLFTNANTGAATLNVNSLGAKSIKKNGSVALTAGNIQAGSVCSVTYDGTNFQLDNSGFAAAAPYKKYAALITQSSTSDPTVTVLENTIGTIVWTRTATGIYTGTLTGAFPSAKTFLTISSRATGSANTFYFFQISKGTADFVTIGTQQATNLPTIDSTDGLLNQTAIEIRVYP